MEGVLVAALWKTELDRKIFRRIVAFAYSMPIPDPGFSAHISTLSKDLQFYIDKKIVEGLARRDCYRSWIADREFFTTLWKIFGVYDEEHFYLRNNRYRSIKEDVVLGQKRIIC